MSYYRKLVLFVFSVMFVGMFVVVGGSQAFANDYYNDDNNIVVNDEVENNGANEIIDDDTVRLLVSVDGNDYDDIQGIISEGVSECLSIEVDNIDITGIDDTNFVCVVRNANGINVDDSIQELSERFPNWLISEDKACVPAQDIPNDCPSPQYWSNYQAPFIRTGIRDMYSLYSMPSVSSKMHETEVAVFDTGFSMNDDIKNRIDWKNSFKLTGNGLSEDDYEPLTQNDLKEYKTQYAPRHGETVSTVLAGQPNNNKFAAGFSVSDKIKLILVVPAKRGDKDGVLWYDSEFDTALRILMKKKASGECPNLRVINISWGSDKNVDTVRTYHNAKSTDKHLQIPPSVSVYQEAYNNGIVTVCAGGNSEDINHPYTDTGKTQCPASFPYTLSVNGLKDNGDIKYQYDEYSTISAVAENILTCGENSLRVGSGTSHATPQVSGALASVFSQNPNLSSDQAVEFLKSTANPLKQKKRGNGSAGELSISNLLNKTRTSALQTVINNELTKKDNVPVNVYRVYNPNSGEHFYTLSGAEKDSLVRVGWRYEGIAWKTVTRSNTPVYRVYNPNSGKHHYTTSVNEKNVLIKAGWRNEGTSWYAPNNKTQIPVYRVYNPNSGEHHYTTSTNERNVLIKAGWRNENIAWYAI